MLPNGVGGKHESAPKRARGRQPSVQWDDSLIAELAQERANGATLASLASRLGVSRERVRQVLVAHGYDALSDASSHARAQQRMDREKNIRRMVREALIKDPSLSWSALATMVGVSRSSLLLMVGDEERALKGVVHQARKVFTEDDLITALREAHRHVGNRTLTYAQYNSWAAARSAPSAALMTFRFGSWSEALKRAGLPANASRRKTTAPRLKTRDLIEWVALSMEETGQSTAAAYDRWARSRTGAPSASLVRHRIGWAQAKAQASQLRLRNNTPLNPTPVRSHR